MCIIETKIFVTGCTKICQTTFGAASDENFVKMTTFRFQGMTFDMMDRMVFDMWLLLYISNLRWCTKK